jgi:lipopolysaccharide transport system ATP-binding protein
MTDTVISIEHLSKAYRLGQIGTGTLSRDLNVWWAKVLGNPNPQLKTGETEQANKDGETIWALKDVSFTVEQGEVLGIIGGNGAGKSTLLKILSSVTAPTSGRVKVKGRIASLLEVGTGFHPDLTGRENVYLNGAILGMSRKEIDRKFDEIVDFSGVEKFIDTPVKRYSSGMYVRLAFAVAAHLDSEILIVDEVLAVGDAEFQKKCLGKMDNAAKEGRTVLLVSHNMGAIESLCQKTIMMEAGFISSIGDTRDVVSKYISSTKREYGTPISLRKDRQGTGKLIFDDIYIDDSQIRNRSLQVYLSIRNQHKKEFKNISLSIVISDYLDRELSNIINTIIDKPIFVGIHGVKVRITINPINLVPGTYSISPFVSSDINNAEIYDWVLNAVNFDVPDYDYYQKGHAPGLRGETIYLDYVYETI